MHSPTPSCPALPSPHTQQSPASVTHTEWLPPAWTDRTGTEASAARRDGPWLRGKEGGKEEPEEEGRETEGDPWGSSDSPATTRNIQGKLALTEKISSPRRFV